MMDYTKRRNLNRGYMKLEVWQKAVAFCDLVWKILNDAKIDFRRRAHAADGVQSVSSNFTEGHSRGSFNECMQHLSISLGSLSELLTRLIGFRRPDRSSLDSSKRPTVIITKLRINSGIS